MTVQTNTSNHVSNCSGTPAIPETALVVEGGGQRGIFTAGILDSWLDNNFNPFALLIGTSAGAQNLSAYITQQSGYAKKSIMELSNHPAFFNIKHSLIGRNAVDLDWYFQKACEPAYQLNMRCAQTQLQGRQLLFSATNIEDLSPAFLEPTLDNWLTTLKASSALPYLYKKGVEINNQQYVDGGVAVPIPIQEAYQRGAKKILVLRTVATQENIHTPWVHKLKLWVCRSNRCPKMLNIITGHENAYHQAIEFIDRPPEDAQVIEIAPPAKLSSQLIGSNAKALNDDYEMGYEMGLQFLASEYAALFKQ